MKCAPIEKETLPINDGKLNNVYYSALMYKVMVQRDHEIMRDIISELLLPVPGYKFTEFLQ